MKMYTIFDACTQKHFGRIYLLENDEHAKRLFTNAVMTDEVMQTNPGDYTIKYLGTYHDDTAEIIPVDPMRVMNGQEALKIFAERAKEYRYLQEQIENLQNFGENAANDADDEVKN